MIEITLSVNNRAEVVTLPVTPSSFTVTKNKINETFETAAGNKLKLIGADDLQAIAFDSFFPIQGHNYPYILNTSMWGMDYVNKIDEWYKAKLPVRLTISDVNINIAVAIDNFEYEIKTDGDIYYSITFGEIDMIGIINSVPVEEDIDMATAEELEKRIKQLEDNYAALNNTFIYNYIDENMPQWAREAVQAAVDCGALIGVGVDDEGNKMYGLNYQDLKEITRSYRAGVYDE